MRPIRLHSVMSVPGTCARFRAVRDTVRDTWTTSWISQIPRSRCDGSRTVKCARPTRESSLDRPKIRRSDVRREQSRMRPPTWRCWCGSGVVGPGGRGFESRRLPLTEAPHIAGSQGGVARLRLPAELRVDAARPHLTAMGKRKVASVTSRDVERLASAMLAGSLFHQGQICLNTRKIIIARSRYGEFLEKFVARTRTLPSGDPLDSGTIIGPLITSAAVALVGERVKDAVAKARRSRPAAPTRARSISRRSSPTSPMRRWPPTRRRSTRWSSSSPLTPTRPRRGLPTA